MSIDSLTAHLSTLQVSDITSEDYWNSLPGYQKITESALSRLTRGSYMIGSTSYPLYKVIYYVKDESIQSEIIEVCQTGTHYALKIWGFGDRRDLPFYLTIPELIHNHYPFLTHAATL